jgi:F-type H+-transporting ATPase subunit b
MNITEILNQVLQVVIPVAQAAEEAAQAEHASGGVLGTLGINGKFFIAQLVNFAVILLILWKWVIPVVAKKLQERQETTEKSLHDARAIEHEKQEFTIWKQSELGKAKKEAGEIITSATAEAGRMRDDILQQTKTEQVKMAVQAKKQIEDEKAHALQSAKAEIADLVTSATERILRQKLDVKKDGELIKESIKNI